MRSYAISSIFQKIGGKFLSKGSFGFNVATLFAGNVSAQVIAFILSPIVTRLYIPEHFGAMMLITAIINVLAVISCMRYEMAVVLPKEDDKSFNIMAVCLFISFSLSLALLPSVPLFGDE